MKYRQIMKYCDPKYTSHTNKWYLHMNIAYSQHFIRQFPAFKRNPIQNQFCPKVLPQSLYATRKNINSFTNTPKMNLIALQYQY